MIRPWSSRMKSLLHHWNLVIYWPFLHYQDLVRQRRGGFFSSWYVQQGIGFVELNTDIRGGRWFRFEFYPKRENPQMIQEFRQRSTSWGRSQHYGDRCCGHCSRLRLAWSQVRTLTPSILVANELIWTQTSKPWVLVSVCSWYYWHPKALALNSYQRSRCQPCLQLSVVGRKGSLGLQWKQQQQQSPTYPYKKVRKVFKGLLPSCFFLPVLAAIFQQADFLERKCSGTCSFQDPGWHHCLSPSQP